MAGEPAAQPAEEKAVEKAVESETRQATANPMVTQQNDGQERAPALPPRPLPAAYPNGKRVSIQQPPIPLAPPFEAPHDRYGSDDRDIFQGHSNPKWDNVKFGMYLVSLAVSAAIFGLGITIGMHTAPYMTPFWYYPSEIELGVSGSAAGLAIIFITLDFLRMCLGTARRGLHPGLLVTFNLFIWILALVAVVMTTIWATNTYYDYDDYDYPSGSEGDELASKTQYYEKVLLGLNCVLLAFHFILFVGACAECHQRNRSKRKTVYITVPPGAPIPGQPAQEMVYQQVRYPPQAYTIVQVPPTNGVQWTAPGRSVVRASVAQPTQWGPPPPPPTNEYEGYYAPAQPSGGYPVPQQQGYYAPQGPSSSLLAPPKSALKSRQTAPAAAAASSSSGSASTPTQAPVETQQITTEPAAEK